MNYDEFLIKRRSVREFEEKAVSQEVVKEIINDSVKAPSAGHLQPCSFIVVQNRKMIKRISDDSTRTMMATAEQDPDSPIMDLGDINVFFNAPCLVIIAGPRRDDGLFAHYSGVDWPPERDQNY